MQQKNNISNKQLKDDLITILKNHPTKEDLTNTLKNHPTKVDLVNTLKNYPTKDDLAKALKKHPTKDDLAKALKNYPTKDDLAKALKNHSTKDDLAIAFKNYPTKDDLTERLNSSQDAFRKEMKYEFQLMREDIKNDMSNFTSKILTAIDPLLQEIKTRQQEREIVASQISEVRNSVNDHEKRIKKLEHS